MAWMGGLQICLYNYVPDRKGLPRELSVIEREQVLGYPDGHMHAYGHGREGYMPAKFEMLGDSFDVRTVAHILAPLRTMQQDGRLPKQITVRLVFGLSCTSSEFHCFTCNKMGIVNCHILGRDSLLSCEMRVNGV